VYERERVQDLEEQAAIEAAKKRAIAEEANLAGVESLFDDMFKVLVIRFFRNNFGSISIGYFLYSG
jgi:hypothetical protein